jgi:hypothetical protein
MTTRRREDGHASDTGSLVAAREAMDEPLRAAAQDETDFLFVVDGGWYSAGAHRRRMLHSAQLSVRKVGMEEVRHHD